MIKNKNVFIPLKKLEFDKDGFIQCPQCGNSNMHIRKTTAMLEDLKELHVTKENVELIHEKGSNGYHYSLYLHYRCENSHYGIIAIIHHEGNLYIEHKGMKK